jgi:hypothetical protein
VAAVPVPALKSIGARYGVPVAEMERFWTDARKQYGTDYAAVMGTVKRMAANYASSRKKHLKG